MGIFAGTAQYYDLYRPSIPTEVVERIVATLKAQTEPRNLLDLGTATGKVLEQFLPHFSDFIAVEPADEMMALAKRRLVRQMPANTSIHFITGTAENAFIPDEWHANLATLLNSFHWMDGPRVLQKLDRIVEPHGMIAIGAEPSLWNPPHPEPWHVVLKRTLEEFLGDDQRASKGSATPPVSEFRSVLAASAFREVEEFAVPVTHTWNIEQLMGLLYSHSFSAKALFGNNVELFERTVRDRLMAASPQGAFIEHNQYGVILARRPQRD